MAHSQWDLSGKPGDPDLRIGGYTTATAAETQQSLGFHEASLYLTLKW